MLLRLDREIREPLGAQLLRTLRDAIRSGHLSACEQLPSSRVLARSLAISRGLITECYGQLEAEGYPEHPAGLGYAGGGRPGHAPGSGPARRSPTAARGRLPPVRARPGELLDAGLAMGAG